MDTDAKSSSQLPSAATHQPPGVFAGGVVVEQGRKVSAGDTRKAKRGAQGQDKGGTCLGGDVWPGGPYYLPTRHTRDWASWSVANNTCGTDTSILPWITNSLKLGMFLELEFIQALKKTK